MAGTAHTVYFIQPSLSTCFDPYAHLRQVGFTTKGPMVRSMDPPKEENSKLAHPILSIARPVALPTCLGDMPESCVASILTHLEPRDICGLARLNRAFRCTSWADFVWI
ncbi:hypothetical protein SAY86_024192 [Trapa natans]|uniref:F-box domain-containing protein n=1 Tax=Trapa natans TaxID=22666 RepID=A0AAN7R8L5_TRANT|nr:hypothetical protein SAY86_024192 [Trapa natans]